VLWQLQGPNKLLQTEFDSHEKAIAAAIAVKGLVKVEPGLNDKWLVRQVVVDDTAPGTMTPVQYQAFVADLVNYLDWMAEPNKSARISIGYAVMLYFGVLFVLIYALKRVYWKDVH
jgi:ubiquinol-cytochrome c reductase cytochrome c1 subunit